MTMKEYKHLNLVQRSVISALKASGIKQKDIALYAECNPSTVSRELSRNKTKTGKYSPKVAQEISEERKERFRKERKFTKEMKVFVIKHITEEQWSVEQIVGYCKKIEYQWLEKQLSINSFTKTKKTEATYTNTLVISLSIEVEHCTLVKRK